MATDLELETTRLIRQAAEQNGWTLKTATFKVAETAMARSVALCLAGDEAEKAGKPTKEVAEMLCEAATCATIGTCATRIWCAAVGLPWENLTFEEFDKIVKEKEIEIP